MPRLALIPQPEHLADLHHEVFAHTTEVAGLLGQLQEAASQVRPAQLPPLVRHAMGGAVLVGRQQPLEVRW